MRQRNYLIGCFLCCLSLPVFAVATQHFDPNLPIRIESDRAMIAQIKQEALYEGNVFLQQGTHTLRAQTLSIKKDPRGKLSVITANGSPAVFTHTLQNDPHPVRASAKTIYYYPDKQLIVLEGLATVDHEHDKFRGPSLSYQLDTQIISAVQKNNGTVNERPTFTLHPRPRSKS